MWVFIACCILKANQAVAGDLYPEQAAAGLWHIVEPSSSPLNDQLDNTTSFTRALKSTNGKIQWFIDNIVNKYGFEENKEQNKWVKQGKFGELDAPEFIAAAGEALKFFKTNSDWATTKATFKADATGKCSDLLAIIAARYLLVTHILFQESDHQTRLIACKEENNKVIIPAYACYPEPSGSATCTSDYDVGLVGPRAGELVEKFNNYFQSAPEGFKKPSDEVLDTNVYAFSLEFSIPKNFELPKDFVECVARNEEDVNFKMQELVSAYYKVFKYNVTFFEQLRDTAKTTLQDTKDFTKWDQKFNMLDLKGDRLTQNKKYQELVKKIVENGAYDTNKVKENLETLEESHLYAAEAYHTRGAIRHVVGGQQLKLDDYLSNKLTTMDLWVSMIENWGDSIKEYKQECFDPNNNPVILEVCVLKMSKYMWRMLAAMCNLRERIRYYYVSTALHPNKLLFEPIINKLVCFSGPGNPEKQMKTWLEEYKKKGSNKIPSNQKDVSQFFVKFDCPDVEIGKPLPHKCLVSINNKVDEFNKKLAAIFSEKHQGKKSDKK